MRYSVQRTVGADRRSAVRRQRHSRRLLAGLSILVAFGSIATAQQLYKYRGPDGEWIYSDRPPDDGSVVEIRQLESSMSGGEVTVSASYSNGAVRLVANNPLFIPVEMQLEFRRIVGLQYPAAEDDLRRVVPARRQVEILSVGLRDTGVTPVLEYGFSYLPGDPRARHRPEVAYRAPFAVASDYRVTQAYPDVVTHTSPDSYYALDIGMPIGTNVFAARDGIVFDVASGNFTSGLDPLVDGPKANVVRIVHADGTYAVYAHLNTNTVRVRPGDRVERGEYIADSGNTGFSSGPHLHFAVLRNAGMQAESLPVIFAGPNQNRIMPATGMVLTAY